MDNKSIQDKETLIVGTVIEANKQLRKFLNESNSKIFKNNKLVKLYESKYADVYEYNMKSLFANITDTNLFNLNEESNFPTAFENKRNNYYSYFKNVYGFLNGYELNLQASLNESISTNDKNSINMNINTFKDFLKKIINNLENQNDIESYTTDIIKIKTFAQQPLFIFGYNICNNVALMKELQERFNLTFSNLLGILYSRKEKQLWFIPINSQNIVAYSIVGDELVLMEKFIKTNLISEQYIEQIKQEKDDNTLIEIHTNPNVYSFKFTDNLYFDNKRKEILMQEQRNKSLIK